MFTESIDTFTDGYRYLSNFYESPILFRTLLFPTAEHAYQAYKSSSRSIQEEFSDYTMTPGQAKRAGAKLKLRENWEDVKLSIMHQIVLAKFDQNETLKNQLIKTQNFHLKEGNHWHDNEWGSCTCERCADRGKNYLGIILMLIRGKYIWKMNDLGW